MPIGDYPPHPMEVRQVKQMLKAIKTKTEKSARDRAMIAIFWRCGLRNAELRSIELDHIGKTEDGERFIRVMHPKGSGQGKQPRNVGLDRSTWTLINAWLKWRGDGPGLLFQSRTGGKIQSKTVRAMIHSRAARCGLTRRVHPHCFRHTYAKDLYDEDVPLPLIQQALGHSNLHQTARYLTHLGCGEVVEVTSKRSFTL